MISSPSENYYSYYAKSVAFTEVGNGTLNVLMITVPMVIRFLFSIKFIAVDEYLPTIILVEVFIKPRLHVLIRIS